MHLAETPTKRGVRLTPDEEKDLGMGLQSGIAIAERGLYERLVVDRELLAAPADAGHKDVRLAKARRKRYGTDGLEGQALKDHAYHLSRSLDHGLHILRTYGPAGSGADADRFVEANQGLAGKIASQYARLGLLPREDLLQEGLLGVCLAVLRFDPDIGKFSTFAHWWIRHRVRRAIEDTGRQIRLPVATLALLGDIEWARRRFEQAHARQPGLEELAAEARCPMPRLLEVLPHLRAPQSLDAPLRPDDDDSGTLHEIAECPTPGPGASLEERERLASVRKHLARLPTMERDLVSSRLGLSEATPYQTLAQLEARSDVGHETIRKRYFRALRKLRSWLEPDLGLV